MPTTPTTKHAGGESSVTIAGTDMGVSDWDCTINNNAQPSTTTLDFNATDGVTYDDKTVTERGMEFSFTAFVTTELTDAAVGVILDAKSCGPIIIKKVAGITGGTPVPAQGWYIALGGISSISDKMSGVNGLQAFTVKGYSKGRFVRGNVAPS